MAFEEAAAFFRFNLREVSTIDRVVDAFKCQRTLGFQVAVFIERAGGGDFKQIVFRRNDRRGEQGFAFGARHDIAHILQVARENILRVFVGGIHQDIFPVITQRGGNRMVEERLRNFFILFRAGHDDDRKGFDLHDAEHRGEQGCFIAADAVAIGERHAGIVRFIAGRFVLGGDAHVADILRNKAKDRVDFIHGIGGSGHQFMGLGFHFRRGFEARQAEVPIPF